MKEMIFVSILALVLSVVFVPTPNAQMAKEGTVSYTMTYTATLLEPRVDLDGPDKEERYAAMYDVLGVISSDTGKGPFHNMSCHYIGLLHRNKEETEKGLAYGVWTDPGGDRVFAATTWDPKGKVAQKLLGGTGKFTGIEGTMEAIEASGIYLTPSKEGTSSYTGQFKIHWKLPETRE